jgi:HSP20 family protein
MPTETRHKPERQVDDQSRPRERASQPRRETERPSFAPFSIMRQGLDEIERSFGAALRGEWDQLRRGWRSQPLGDWSPAIETFQRGNEFVIRADVPGMNRQDLEIEVGDDQLTIHGERRQDRQEERDGVFFTERSYGSFTRMIPLPSGAITDSAKATFNNGVLEIVMQAPAAEARRGRRLDISGGREDKA